MAKIKDEYKCPLEATMDIIGGKYKGGNYRAPYKQNIEI